MALVQLPDGRWTVVRDDLSQYLGGQPQPQQLGQAPAPMFPGVPIPAPTPVTTQPEIAPPVSPEPSPIQHEQTAATDVSVPKSMAQEKALADARKAAMARQAYEATPEGQAQVADRAHLAAIGEEKQAAQQQGDIESAKAQEVATAQQAGAAEEQRIAAERSQMEQERAAGLAKVNKTYGAAVDKWATTKIDDSRKWKDIGTGRQVLAGISVLLSGLGDALAHRNGPNAAIQIIDNAIDKDVAAQVREREELGKRAQLAHNSIDDYRQGTGDMRQAADLKQAEARRRVAREIELIGAKYGDPEAQARAKQAAAMLDEKAAGYIASAAERSYQHGIKAQELGMQKQQIAIAGYNASIAARHAALAEKQFEWQKSYQDKQLDLEAQKLDASGQAAQAKLVRERGIPGIVDPKTGQAFVAAGSEPNVTKAQSTLPKYREAIGLLDEATRLRTGWSNSVKDREEWQRLRTIWGSLELTAKDLKDLGQIQGADAEYLEKYLGTDDPTQMRDPAAAIKQARQNMVRGAKEMLRGVGWEGDIQTVFPELKAGLSEPTQASEVIQTGQTPLEESAAQEPGVVGKVAERITPDVAYKVFGGSTSAERKQSAEQGGSLDIPGLSDAQAKATRSLLYDYTNKTPEASAAAQQLLDLATNNKRPTVQNPILRELHDNAPDLFARALAQMPAAERAEWLKAPWMAAEQNPYFSNMARNIGAATGGQ